MRHDDVFFVNLFDYVCFLCLFISERAKRKRAVPVRFNFGLVGPSYSPKKAKEKSF